LRTPIVLVVLLTTSACASGGDSEAVEFVPLVTTADAESSSTGEELLVDDRPVERATGVPPISGGTLLVLEGGDVAVATDPDRDLIHVANVGHEKVLATVALESGDAPGRAAQDGDGVVHVLLRGAGAIVSIEPADGTVLARHPTCANPRGIAWDGLGARMLVACAGGEIVAHAPGGEIETRVDLVPDLRDVLVHESRIRVTRFRTAEVLELDADLAVVDVATPTDAIRDRRPGTAWHTVVTPDGGWLMVHQNASTAPINLDVPQYYDGGAGCSGPVASILAMYEPGGRVSSSGELMFATLAVDAAISPDGAHVAIAVAGQSDWSSPTMQRTRGVMVMDKSELTPDPGGCVDPDDHPVPGQPVAVAFADERTLVVQSREPAALYVLSLADDDVATIELEGESRRDTGHDLFHQDAGTGLACASCHPEGGDDGRVWTFVPGPIERRTQALDVGLADTEPLHWSGDMLDFEMLANEIHARRMGALAQSPERLDAFREWVFEIVPPNPERVEDDAVLAGRQLFVDRGCAGCHDDDALAVGRAAEIRGEVLQAPSLRGVAVRPPYMHDGRVADLRAAVLDMVALTPGVTLETPDLEAIVAYLESL
jgi:mono/diheme cytochrome c family protein